MYVGTYTDDENYSGGNCLTIERYFSIARSNL